MIVYYSGPEGACKSVFVAYEAHKHYELGGEVWAFPGFELFDDDKNVVSRTVQFHDLPSLLDDMLYILLVIDEIQNYMNHHNWYSKMIDFMTYGAIAQRRKRQFVILATGPLFATLPPDLRAMFHEVVHCQDRHWKNKSIPRGQQCEFFREDRRGVLSGYVGTRTRPQIFWPAKSYKYYDTYALTDPRAQFAKYKMKGNEIIIGPDGRVVQKQVVPVMDAANMDKRITEYVDQQNSQDDHILKNIESTLNTLKGKGINRVKTSLIYEILGVRSQSEKWKIGHLIKKHFGVTLQRNTGMYVLPEIAPSE